MHTKQIEAFKKILNEVIENVKTPYTSEDLQRHRSLKIDQETALIDAGVPAYEKLSAEMWRKLKCDDKFTHDEFNDLLKSLIVQCAKIPQKSPNELIEELINYLEHYNIEQIIYLPLENVEMQGINELKVGSFLIVKMTDDKVEELAQRVMENFQKNIVYNPDEKSLFTEDWLKNYIVPLKGKFCLEYRYISGAKKARKRAYEEALRLMDLLRYSIPSIFSEAYPAYFYPDEMRERERQEKKETKNEYRVRTRSGIGLQGELPLGINRIYTFASDNSAMDFNGRFIGMRPFTLNSDNIAIMEQLGIFRLAELLEKKEPTPFEDTVLRSIHWFANAQIQLEIEDELLDLVTSIETILAPKEGILMDAASYGIAFIIGDSVDQKEKLMERYKNIYSKRSGCSHHGMREADEVDLIEIRYMAQKVLDFSVKNPNNWEKQEQLLEWVKTRKLQ